MSRLAQHMAFYAAYHQDKRNKLTHVFGVPTIVFAILLAMACVPLGVELAGVPVTLATAFVAVMVAFYIYLDVVIGLTMAVFTVAVLWLAHWVAGMDAATIWIVGLATFIGGWAVQLLGHKFEGNKPALTQNLLQIFVAPLFLTAELFFALGLKKDVEAEVERRVRDMGPEAGGRTAAA